MGILDNIRNFFGGSKSNTPVEQEDPYRKSMLATQIMNLIDKLKRKNSFDSSLWNLSNMSESALQRKSLAELENLHTTLTNKLQTIDRQTQRPNPQSEALEASKWTGQKPSNMTAHDFDFWQKD